jgi:3-isopropylmalate/(R)-2-methylmalate dehydratase small subunit
MSKDTIKGKVYVVGDNIDTDVIIPARYLTTMDPKELGKHAMEDLDPKQYPTPFLKENGSCDYQIIVAGKNFGCGSSREHAPIALHAAGIEAVIASSFARIYYRNSVNGGIILPLELEDDLTAKVKTGDMLEVLLSQGVVQHEGAEYHIKPFGHVKDIIEAGGLTAYNKKRLGL